METASYRQDRESPARRVHLKRARGLRRARAKVSGQVGGGWNSAKTAAVAVVDDLVVVEVEEHLLLQNRAADGAAEVVVAQKRDWTQLWMPGCQTRTGTRSTRRSESSRRPLRGTGWCRSC